VTERSSSATYQLTKEKYLSDVEYQHLMSILKRFMPTCRRDCLLIALAALTGARATEILNLEKQDFDTNEGSVFIRSVKGGKDREIPLADWLVRELRIYLTDKDGRIFGITYQRFQKIWCNYRPAKKKLHSLRHTFAIRLYAKTKDLRLVQYTLGHRSISNTLIYAEYHYTQSELRKFLI